jgi:excisionase family DNA binding protein
MREPTLTKAEAARCLGVTRPTIYAWIRRGIIPTIEIDGHDRIPASAIGSRAASMASAFKGFRKIPFLSNPNLEAPATAM